MIGLIYKITSPNGRIYIGQSTNYKRRLKAYRTSLAKTQVKLHNSFLKYGINNHIFEIIVDNVDIENLSKLEEYYIKFFRCVEEGLNCSYDATAFMRGLKHSDEAKLKMSKTRLGIKLGPCTEEHKKALSESIKLSYKNGRRKHALGTKLSDITKNKIRIAHTGIKLSEAHKAKISLAGKGAKRSQEIVDNMIINHKRSLSTENIILIRDEKYLTLKAMALKYNTSISTVSDIRRGKRGYLKYINN